MAHFRDESASEDPRSTLANGGKARSRERALTREEAQLDRLDMRSMRFQSTKPSRDTFPN